MKGEAEGLGHRRVVIITARPWTGGAAHEQAVWIHLASASAALGVLNSFVIEKLLFDSTWYAFWLLGASDAFLGFWRAASVAGLVQGMGCLKATQYFTSVVLGGLNSSALELALVWIHWVYRKVTWSFKHLHFLTSPSVSVLSFFQFSFQFDGGFGCSSFSSHNVQLCASSDSVVQ